MKTLNEVIQEQIDDIMDWFDFEKMADILVRIGNTTPYEEDGEFDQSILRRFVRKRLYNFRDDIILNPKYDASRHLFSDTAMLYLSCDRDIEDGKKWIRISARFCPVAWDFDGEYYI
jgi:hypothetical protein